MCGISGIFHFNNSRVVKESEVTKMRDTLIHRGPDDAGSYVSPDKKVGLGTRRLKIIDLSEAGHMPMSAEGTRDKRQETRDKVWITYNGEVYNFKVLRAELEKKGYRFHSRTDTEVILNAYIEYGFDCVKKFNGMFAFAIWDEKRKLLFAARDHIGIKPFYWAVQNGTFYFGSEIKAILAHPDFKKELDLPKISYYLTYGAMPAPYTLFKDIRKLPPAHTLIVRSDSKLEEKEYWSPLSREHHTNKKHNEEYYAEEIKKILKESIEAQMVSDVPFGCFLSGGIDSSVNAALMSRALGLPIETFSIGTNEHEKYNEFQYSRKAAELLKAKIHERVINRNDFIELLKGGGYAYHADDPNADYVCVMVYYLSEFIKKSGVIVAQVGEGADELFAGYEPYKLVLSLHDRIWKNLERFPRFLKKIPYLATIPISSPRIDFHKEYLRRLGAGEEPFWGLAIGFTPTHKKYLLQKEFGKTLAQNHEYEIADKFYRTIRKLDPEADFLEQMTYLEIKNRLAELLLMRVDKMSMAHSIEARVPFLDYRLVELALHIPQSIKLKNQTTKYILKKAVRGIIPDDIIDRKKQGFGAPVEEWLRDKEKSKPFFEMIRNSKLKKLGIMNYEYIEKLFRSHQRTHTNNCFRIWTLLTLSVWYDYWFK